MPVCLSLWTKSSYSILELHEVCKTVISARFDQDACWGQISRDSRGVVRSRWGNRGACLQEQLMVALTYNFGGQVLSSLSLLNCTKQSYKRLITNSQRKVKACHCLSLSSLGNYWDRYAMVMSPSDPFLLRNHMTKSRVSRGLHFAVRAQDWLLRGSERGRVSYGECVCGVSCSRHVPL